MSPKILILSALCAILLSTLVSADASQPKGYQGCYGDEPDRALSVWTKDVDSITECIDICKEKKLPYAGLEYYTQCYCGGDFHRYGKSDACDLKCKKGGICGGSWALSVYLVSDKFLPNKKLYIGCFKDAAVMRTMRWMGNVDDVSSCIKMCKDEGKKYAGLQYYDQCRCADHSYNKWGKVKEYECMYPCKNGGICGGDLVNSVYRTLI